MKGPKRLETVLDSVLDALGLAQGVERHSVFREWEQRLGPEIARAAHPHRVDGDTLIVRVATSAWLNELSLRQGERRTAVVALRLMEAEVLEADTGERPILLLDDVFSELDEGRAERLLDRLGDRHQRFITSPRPLPWLTDGLVQWTVSGGRIDCPAEAAAG